MKPFPRLRVTLRNILLASLPLVNVGGCPCPPDETETVRYTLDREQPRHQSLISKCESVTGQATEGECLDACRDMLADRGVVPDNDEVYWCRLFDDGTSTDVEINYLEYRCEGAGRKPAGLRELRAIAAHSAVASWLVRMAYLEAASVYAFVRTARELDRFGAPRQLVERALVAADDEIRHATAMAQLARAHGGRPVGPQVDAIAPRSLAELAHENAIEGCTAEAFGALVCAWQAHRAVDADIAATFASIARDEMGHAEPSFDIHRWARTRLPAAEASAVERARQQAIEQVACAEYGRESAAVRELLGLPDVSEGRLLAGRFATRVQSLGGASRAGAPRRLPMAGQTHAVRTDVPGHTRRRWPRRSGAQELDGADERRHLQDATHDLIGIHAHVGIDGVGRRQDPARRYAGETDRWPDDIDPQSGAPASHGRGEAGAVEAAAGERDPVLVAPLDIGFEAGGQRLLAVGDGDAEHQALDLAPVDIARDRIR